MSSSRNDDWKNDTLKMRPVNSAKGSMQSGSFGENEYVAKGEKNVSGYTIALIVIATIILCLSIILAIVNNSSDPEDEKRENENSIIQTEEIPDLDDEISDTQSDPGTADDEDEITEDEKEDTDEETPENTTSDDQKGTDENASDNIGEAPDDNTNQPPKVSNPDNTTENQSGNAPSDIPDISELD